VCVPRHWVGEKLGEEIEGNRESFQPQENVEGLGEGGYRLRGRKDGELAGQCAAQVLPDVP
jgi:hypothetical protein